MNFWTRGYRVSGNQTINRRNGRLCHVFEAILPQQFTAAGLKLSQLNMLANRSETQYDGESRCGVPGVLQQRALASARYAAELGSTVMSHSLSSHSGT